jgi:N utilization substance protein A
MEAAMNNEFFEALGLLEKEKKIPAEQLLERIKNAILIAVRRNYGCEDNVIMDVDMSKGKFDVYIRKNVVDDVTDPAREILEADAVKYKNYKKSDGFVDIKLDPKEFGRIAAQSAKHVIRQGIREEERSQMFETFQKHQFELLDAIETDDGRYVALLPCYDDPSDLVDDDGELIILKVENDNGEDTLVAIEDEKTFDEIAEIFEERLSDLYEIEDMEGEPEE